MPKQADISDGRHTCIKCGARKLLSEFSKRSTRPLGVNSTCKECIKAINRAAYVRNAEKNRASAKAYREANTEAVAAWQAEYREANRETLRAYFRDYGRRNPHKKRAVSVARRSKKLNATPPWANGAEIAAFYERAKRIESRTGTKMHVDHIVPLVNPLVCGLHCEANLRIVPAKVNLRKSNLFWPNMP